MGGRGSRLGSAVVFFDVSSGAWAVIGAVVGAAALLAGGYVDRAARARGELVGAGAAWLAATESLALAIQVGAPFMATQPTTAPGRALEWLAEQIEATIGPGRVEMMRALAQRPIMKRYEALTDRVWETTARLVVVAPVRTLRRLEPHLETLAAWMRNPSDEGLRRQWEDVARPEVVKALRSAAQPRRARLVAWLRRRPA